MSHCIHILKPKEHHSYGYTLRQLRPAIEIQVLSLRSTRRLKFKWSAANQKAVLARGVL